MKMFKKIGILFMSLCLCIPCFSMVAHAEDGRISFTDPKTAVGEMVNVDCAIRSTSGDVGEVEMKLTYDSAYLRFDSGDGVTKDGDGALTFTNSGSSSEVKFTMTFQALQEGTTEIAIDSAAISSAGGTSLTMTQGQSRVEIGEGDPSKSTESSSGSMGEDMQVEVNGTAYTLPDDFPDADIPSGYSRTQVELDGQQRHVYCSPLSNSEWYLVTVMPYGALDEVVSDLGSDRAATMLAGCGILLAATLVVFFLYLRMILIMGVSLYTSRVILRALGEVDFGLYNVVGGIIVIFSFMTNSMASTASRYIAVALGTGDKIELQKVTSTTRLIQIFLAAVILILAETLGLWLLLHKFVIPRK